MIIDCFTFFNELDLLEIRLEELNNSVDYFVLVEANKTQSLNDKIYYFEENKEKYNKFLHKIIHVKIDDCPNNTQNLWTMENFQRNCITRGLQGLNLKNEDIILISDLDEIPNSKIIYDLKSVNLLEPFSIDMMFSAYFVNLVAKCRTWVGTVACPFSLLNKYTPQDIRGHKDFFKRTVSISGWHFSWLGGYEKIYEKAHSCIEPFDKTQLPSKEDFKIYFDKFIDSNNKFFIHLENLSKQETEFIKIDMNELFPLFMRNNLEKYSKLILK
jgi:beta-1,4-mannosyl-glycoprotein beta-1,4-N-acetylglucosaminyltransferase